MTPARLGRGLRMVLAACVGVLLVAGLVVALRPTSANGAAFSYLTASDLVVASGDGVIARAAARPATGGNATTTTWTSDGQYAMVVAEGPGGPDDVDGRTLVVISRDGDVARRPCQSCTTVAPVGGSTVLAARTTVSSRTLADSAPFAGLLRFDLSSSGVGTPLLSSLSTAGLSRVFLLGGADGTAYAGAEQGDGREVAFAVDRDGGAVPIGAHARGQAPRGADQRGIGTAAVNTDVTGTLLAVAASYRNSDSPSCGTAAEIYLYRPGQPESQGTDLAAAVPAGHSWGVDSNVAVLDLWWGGDGRLRTVFAIQPCGPADGDPVPRISTWVLNGDQWAADGGDGLLADRVLDSGRRVVLRAEPDPGSGVGRIAVVAQGQSLDLDSEVESFSVSTTGGSDRLRLSGGR